MAVFTVYLVSNLTDARTSMAENRTEIGRGRSVSRRQLAGKLTAFVVGIAAIVMGSQMLICYGSKIAILLGVPAGIIGVTMVAIGTSLPELVTTLTAISRREASMSVGNIIGANVIDLTMILPVCSAVSGGRLTLSRQTIGLDMPVCLGMCALAGGSSAADQGKILSLAGSFDAGSLHRLCGGIGPLKKGRSTLLRPFACLKTKKHSWDEKRQPRSGKAGKGGHSVCVSQDPKTPRCKGHSFNTLATLPLVFMAPFVPDPEQSGRSCPR
ncbi:MAG: hypothetical protein V8R75_06370 [Oscillospiraceae bacterium]